MILLGSNKDNRVNQNFWKMKTIKNASKSPKDAETTKNCILATAWLQIEKGDVYRQLGNFGVSFLFSSDPDMPNEAVHLLLEAALTAGRCGLFLLAQG